MKHDFKEFVWCTSNDVIRNIRLRETKSYLISETGQKYKKGEYSDGAVAYKRCGDKWHTSSYYIHTVDSPWVAKCIEKRKRTRVVVEVRNALRELSTNVNTYAKAIEIAEKLGIKYGQ